MVMTLENILYIKKSLGRNGRVIDIYKIRTMPLDADEHLDEALSAGLDNLGKPHNDPRLTKVGRFLRRYGIDELPQIYNIVRGELSFVGVRPRREKDWKDFPESHKEEALKYKPGFFGVQYSQVIINNFEHLIQVESDYLKRKEQKLIHIDFIYFLKITYNFLFHRARGR